MKIGFYAGSFDPFTYGHLHVVEESLKLFDKVVIGITNNRNKPSRRFDQELMKQTIERVLENRNITNVEVVSFDSAVTATMDIAKEKNSLFLVRGLRNATDYNEEEDLSSINQEFSGLDTIYIRGGKLSHISSSKAMELFCYGKDLSKYLPEEVLEVLKK